MGDAHFPKSARLRRKADFDRIFAKSEKSVDGCFTLLYRGNGLPHARLGLAISLRCARAAVARNRIKRVIRESFRRQQRALVGLDIVVIGRSGLSGRSNVELFASLTRHWETLVR